MMSASPSFHLECVKGCLCLSHFVTFAWVLKVAKLMQAVIGTTKATRVIDSAKAGDIELTRKQWYEIYLAAGNELP